VGVLVASGFSTCGIVQVWMQGYSKSWNMAHGHIGKDMVMQDGRGKARVCGGFEKEIKVYVGLGMGMN